MIEGMASRRPLPRVWAMRASSSLADRTMGEPNSKDVRVCTFAAVTREAYNVAEGLYIPTPENEPRRTFSASARDLDTRALLLLPNREQDTSGLHVGMNTRPKSRQEPVIHACGAASLCWDTPSRHVSTPYCTQRPRLCILKSK